VTLQHIQQCVDARIGRLLIEGNGDRKLQQSVFPKSGVFVNRTELGRKEMEDQERRLVRQNCIGFINLCAFGVSHRRELTGVPFPMAVDVTAARKQFAFDGSVRSHLAPDGFHSMTVV
jgi:hypothetical protein